MNAKSMLAQYAEYMNLDPAERERRREDGEKKLAIALGEVCFYCDSPYEFTLTSRFKTWNGQHTVKLCADHPATQ